MAKRKLLIAITNRSSYNKVKTVIQNLPDHIEAELLLGGSLYLYHYGMVGEIIEKDFPDLRIWKVSMLMEGDDLSKMSKSVGAGTIELSTIIENSNPHLVLTVADRFETMATAIAASYTNKKLVHLQGGEVSGTIDDKVRNAVTQLADYHFPATYEAADRIANMKMQDMERIWAYGCPAMDTIISNPIVSDIYNGKKQGDDLCHNRKRLIPFLSSHINSHGVGPEIDFSKKYIIVMMHPDTTGEKIDDEHMGIVLEALNNYGCQKIIFWNNIDPGGNIIAKNWRMTQHEFWKDRTRYVRHVQANVFGALMINASMIVGNSSAGIREATFLGVPSITIGDRQKGRDHASNVVSCGFIYSDIIHHMNDMGKASFVPNDMYGSGDAGSKIANKIEEIIHGRILA